MKLDESILLTIERELRRREKNKNSFLLTLKEMGIKSSDLYALHSAKIPEPVLNKIANDLRDLERSQSTAKKLHDLEPLIEMDDPNCLYMTSFRCKTCHLVMAHNKEKEVDLQKANFLSQSFPCEP